MSMLSEQVNKIRKVAKCVYLATDKEVADDISSTLNQAANTIEALSAKLQSANMKNGGRWIYCGDGKNLPKEKEWYMTTCVVGNGSPFSQELYFDGAKFDTEEIEAEYYYTLCKVLAWQPLPEPYCPEPQRS